MTLLETKATIELLRRNLTSLAYQHFPAQWDKLADEIRDMEKKMVGERV